MTEVDAPVVESEEQAVSAPAAPSSSAVVVDALPYIDHGYDEPGVREAALALVEEETRRYRPTKNYLEHLPSLSLNAFETPLLRSEFDRVSSRTPMDTLSMKRYELPTPPAGKMTDVAAWGECVENSRAQLEHQRTRIMNLDLMLDYGCESWKQYNEALQDLHRESQAQLAGLKKEVQEVNWARKNQQTLVGEKLRGLESSWVGLVSKNYEIEQALVRMEADLQRMQAESGTAAETTAWRRSSFCSQSDLISFPSTSINVEVA